MPRIQEERIEQRKVLDPISKPEDYRVVARPVDTTVAPAADVELHGLVSGLTALNPKLGEYLRYKTENEQEDARVAGRKQADLEALDPNRAIYTPGSAPEGVNPAYTKHFESAYRQAVGVRTAATLRDDMLSEWDKIKLQEGTNAEKFISEWTAKNMRGFDDPTVLHSITQSHVETVKAIRSEARTVLFRRLTDSQKANVGAMFSSIRGDMSNEDRWNEFQKIVPQAIQSGVYTRPEITGLLLDRLDAISKSQGGAPEVYDAFTEFRDPTTGKTLAELNPALAERVAVNRAAADAEVDKRLNKSMEPLHYEKMRGWEERAAAGNPPSDADLKAEIGPRGMFPTMEAALAARHRLYKVSDERASLAQGVNLARSGMLSAIPKKEDQQKAMDAITAPLVAPLFAAMNTPGMEAQADQAITLLATAHANSGGNVANRQLQNAFDSLKQRAIGKDAEPDAQFITLANAYSKMPPNLKAVYAADEDVRAILESYNGATQDGRVDPKSAYQQAFKAVDPEAKKQADEFRRDPEKRAMVGKMVRGEFTKDGFMPNFLRSQWSGTYPTNEDTVVAQSQLYAEQLIRTNPSLIGQPDVMKKLVQQRVTESWVYDTAANVLVEVPRGDASPNAAKAVSLYSEKMRVQYGEDAKPELRHLGNGEYQLWSATTNKYLGNVKLKDMVGDFHAKSALDPRTKEGERLNAIHKAALAGTLTAAMLAGEGDLLAKARSLDLLSPQVMKTINEARDKVFKDGILTPLDNAPRVSLEGADYALAKSDGRSMTNLASHLWATERHGMALTAMSEGVRLRAYKDNKGTAIGVGYNMDMNAKNLPDDFRRAGIPVDRLDDIKSGKLSLTEDQAIRLFAVSYQRHEAIAKSAVDSKYGAGSWAKLPATKRAVLADVAFQAGTPAKFPEQLDALVNNIGALSTQNPKVHYKANGEMVEDTKRNAMRLRMLGGLSSFGQTIAYVGKKPRNMIESHAQQQ